MNDTIMGGISQAELREKVEKAFSVAIGGNYPNAKMQIEDLTINNDGSIVVDYNVYNENIIANHNPTTIFFTPHNNLSMHRIAISLPSINGYSEGAKEALKTGFIDNNYTFINVNECSSSDEIYNSIPIITESLNSNFSKERELSYDFRYTLLGEDASVVKTIDCAEAIISHNKNGKPIDFMLANAVGGASEFVDRLNTTSNLKQELIETGSIIYIYEDESRTNFNETINNYGKLTDDGMIVIGVSTPKETSILSKEPDTTTITSKSGIASGEEYYLLTQKPSIVKTGWDYYESRIIINENQLKQFIEYRETKGKQPLKSYLDEITTYALTDDGDEGKFINLADNSFEVKDENVLFKFQTIIDKANSIINKVNNTSFNNNSFDYQFSENSTTDFPESLNIGNAILYNISNNLLDNVVNDTHNISQILKNYLYLDYKFADKAIDIMDDMYNSGKMYLEDIDLKNIDLNSRKNADYSIFSKNNIKGHTGKISMTDIDSILKGSSLSGFIGNGLKNEYDDALKLQNEIKDLISLSSDSVSGIVWAAEKKRLEKLANLCTLRMESSKILEDAYIKALKLVKDYIGNDEYLDDSELDKYKEELAIYKAVTMWKNTGKNNDYGEPIYEKNEPAYTNARNKITALEAKITKLEGLANILNQANKIIKSAIDDVSSNYGNSVFSYDNIHIGDISIS